MESLNPRSGNSAAAPMENSIELKGVSKSFKETEALRPINITIRPGAVTGLVGPDGAGKTTLMRILAGLLKPTSGETKVAGLDPVKQSRALHEIIGYMPQRFGLYEDLTVHENLELYSSLRGVEGREKEESFKRLLRFTSLGPFGERLAGKLSGGMKQKLGLACTLLGRPRVLLLDEPGVGVDPISRRELWAMVYKLAEEGMLILWSTSYMDEADHCRDVLLFNQGELLYNGAPQKLTQTMQGRTFLAPSPDGNNRALLQKILFQEEVSDASIQGRHVRVILRKEASASQLAQKMQMKPEDFSAAEPRFEDAFIDLLGGSASKKSALGEIMAAVPAAQRDIPVIEAKELTKTFGTFTATNHVNFQVRRGEIFGLLGPNGAGKSTTFKMMCGLLKPSSGQALVMGLDLKKKSSEVRQKLGYMAQKFSLYGGLSATQNLTFFSGVYGLSGAEQKNRVEEMVNAFKFTPILNRNADELPLGYKQRLALACALMHRPDILFLDEPTSGVDPLTRREFWLHINSMVEKGVTVMVTTHFMDEAEYCDRIGLVYHGKLIAAGSPDELKQMVKSEDLPDPTMEDAFIGLVKNYDDSQGEPRCCPPCP